MRDIVPVHPRFRFLNVAIDFSRFVHTYSSRKLSRVYLPVRRNYNVFRGRQIFKAPPPLRR